MAIPTLLELAEAGAHFGHHRSMVYPKAKNFVYTIKNNVALINLEQTQEAIHQAQVMIDQYRQANKTILFVGTKRTVQQVVRETAEAINAAYITERWFGGTLTNFETILSSLKRMRDLEEHLTTSKVAALSKKERLTLERKLARYHRFLGGLKNIKTMPDLIVVASASEDGIAISEAKQLNIPVIAITDTDINPQDVTLPIPANDDAPKAVELIMRSVIEAPSAKKEAVKTEKTAKAEKEEILDEPKAKKTVKKVKSEKAEKVEKPAAKKTTKKVTAKK